MVNYSEVKTIRIYLVTIAANISAIVIGTSISWSSPMGPKLTSPDSTDSPLNRPVTVNENAWISSIFTLGAITTPFIAGPMADKIGRKRVLLFNSMFFILGYIILLIAKEVWILLVGRLVLGFGCGIGMCVIPVYVAEISTDNTRGATSSFMSFLMCVGLCYTYCIGPYVSYVMMQYLCLLLPIIFVIVFVFMPETPYYFLAKTQRLEASKSLQFLRGQNEQTVETELISIEKFVAHSMTEKTDIFEIVKTAGNRKALLISLGLFTFQQFSGASAVIYYSQTIFESAHISLDAPVAAIIAGFVQLISAGAAPIVVNKFGRKTLLLYSAVLISVTHAALGYFFYSQIVFSNTNGITWLPLTCLVIYDIAYCLGFGPVPWTIFSEIFSQNTKANAAALCTSLSWLVGFIVTLFYPTLDALGAYYAFWLFACFGVLAYFFVLFIVIETKGLNFVEIQTKINKH